MDCLEFCNVIFPAMAEEELETHHLSTLSAPSHHESRLGRNEECEVEGDGDSEGDAKEGREGREGAAKGKGRPVAYRDFLAYTSEAERRKLLEIQFASAFNSPPPQLLRRAEAEQLEKTALLPSSSSTPPAASSGSARGGGDSAQGEAAAAAPVRPGILRSQCSALYVAQLLRSNSVAGSGADELARDARQMAARLKRTHTAVQVVDGTSTQLHLQQTLKRGLELLTTSMAARLQQVESKTEKELASMRREVQSQSEVLRAISARLGAPTAARLSSNTGSDTSALPAGKGGGRRPSSYQADPPSPGAELGPQAS